LDLPLEEFVAGADSFLARRVKKAPRLAEPGFPNPSDGALTRAPRWVGREGHVQFIVGRQSVAWLDR
jgi:hypothetical protein